MSGEWWGIIGVVVGAVLAGGINWMRDRTAERDRASERRRSEQMEAFTQLLVAARQLRYAARPGSVAEKPEVDEYKTNLSSAQYLIDLMCDPATVAAGEVVHRSVLDYINARRERGPGGDCEAERHVARDAVKDFTKVARPTART